MVDNYFRRQTKRPDELKSPLLKNSITSNSPSSNQHRAKSKEQQDLSKFLNSLGKENE